MDACTSLETRPLHFYCKRRGRVSRLASTRESNAGCQLQTANLLHDMCHVHGIIPLHILSSVPSKGM